MADLLQEIEAQIAGAKAATAKQNVGVIREIGDGVARVEGLTDAMLNEMLDLGHGITGLALDLDETEVGVIILGDYTQLEEGDEVLTYARIDAQNIHIPMPRCKVDLTIDEGDVVTIGDKALEVWSTPGHTAGQLSFRMGPLLFSGDNVFRDGCVGVIDAHHGSNLVDFVASLRRILASDVKYLLPSHGPIFRKDDALLGATIARLESYTHMADFGTCAIDWPLLDQWEDELAQGHVPL